MIDTLVDALEGEFSLIRKYVILKIKDKMLLQPLFEARHSKRAEALNFPSAVLEAVGDVVPQGEKLKVANLTEEGNSAHKKITGELLLAIAGIVLKRQHATKAERKAPKESSAAEDGGEKGEGKRSPYQCLIRTYDSPCLSQLFLDSVLVKVEFQAILTEESDCELFHSLTCEGAI